MKRSVLRVTVLLVAVMLVMGTVGMAFAQGGDTLTILYWQAVSNMNPYLSGGTKEIDAATLVIEPLARYDENGNLVPWLVEEIPTLENGGVSEDLTTITWKIKEGILWSDGSPLTAADAVFTWQYCTNPETACTQPTNWADVSNIEAVDDLTVKITFGVAKPFPYGPLVGSTSPLLQKAQFENCVGAAAQNCTEQNFAPIGTGPYVVEEFRANDVVTFTANPNYREEGKPYFKRVIFKGGGDAEAAARAVLETGEADYAWNLSVAPAILNQMEAAGVGTLIYGNGTAVERLHLNHSNPDPALGDLRAVWVEDGSNAHPFLTNPAVYKAMSMAIDRQLIADQLYAGGKPTCNLVPAPAAYVSTTFDDTCFKQDLEGAKKLLDDAGIVDSDGDGIRELDGVPLKVLYQTTTNAVRQGIQALVKQWWDEIGISTELRNIDAAVFFGGDPASPDTAGKFYADVEMFTNNFDGTDPEAYMNGWTCEQIAGPENSFNSNNYSRWCNPEYDALVAELAKTGSLEARADIVKKLNDMIVEGGGMIGITHRADVSAINNTLEGVRMNPWDGEPWNIADWTRAS